MKFIELFAGIGGFRLGLENKGHECVFANEWLEKPASIYEKNFGDRPNGQDIRTIDPNTLPKADLICGGFPCATFSVAGRRTGFSDEDARGSLFFEICRILRATRTPYVFLENVKGLLSSDDGRTFGIILFTLDALGYDVQWEVLNSSNFGVPQNRERVFIIGNLRGYPRPKVFPIGRTIKQDACPNIGKQKTREGLFSDISPTLDANYYKGGASRPYVYENDPEITQWRRGFFRDYKSDGTPTLTANMGTGGHNVPFVNVTAIKGDIVDRKNPKGQYGYSEDKMFTLRVAQNHYIGQERKIRRLTPMECERLQGFPDNFTKYYADGSLVSDSERYERCGRTVSVPVIEAIAEKLGTEWY
jgi:DNA (cytosine-5)-methyltransferase 1